MKLKVSLPVVGSFARDADQLVSCVFHAVINSCFYHYYFLSSTETSLHENRAKNQNLRQGLDAWVNADRLINNQGQVHNFSYLWKFHIAKTTIHSKCKIPLVLPSQLFYAKLPISVKFS